MSSKDLMESSTDTFDSAEITMGKIFGKEFKEKIVRKSFQRHAWKVGNEEQKEMDALICKITI